FFVSFPCCGRLKDVGFLHLTKVPEEELCLFLGLTLGRQELPWAPLSLLKTHAPRPAGASRVRASAIGEGAASGISRRVGTNAIAKIQSAVASFVAGKLAADKQSGARPPK
ncbi:MAG: hypothetical protein ACREP1_01095, partial [Rhodanobacteraceae bacterium]